MSQTGWFGTLPERWAASRIRNLFSLRDERNSLSMSEVRLLSLYGAIGVIPHDDLEKTTGNRATTVENYKIVREGDIIVNIILCWQGAIGLSKWSGVTSPAYDIYQPKSDALVGRYYHYLMRLPAFSGECYKVGHGIMAMRWRTYSDDFTNIIVPLPPRDEQDKIVRYLDWKVSRVNALINAKRRQIALLSEQKRAIVNEAVTKGGEGWIAKPLKYWAKSNVKSLSSNTDSSFELLYLDISSIGHGYVKQEPTRYAFGDAPSRARRIVEYGDTIISNVRTYLRSVCYVNHEIENCIVSTGFSVLSPDKETVLPELLSFVLSADSFIDDVIKSSIGVSYPAISDSKLMNLKVSLPLSLSEQEKIYDDIRHAFDLFDNVIAKIQREISLLHEYRTRLISDVVTGKLDVRGVAVPEYEITEEIVQAEPAQPDDETEDTENAE